MVKVDFFVVGAPKCGTTAMYTYLSVHPQIYMPEWKEPHFFGSDLDFRDQRRPTPEEYQGLFAAAKVGEKLGEASVFYLYSKRAAEEIHQHNPGAKIIIMLRNPVDMLYSYHSQRLYNGTEDIVDFSAALAAEPNRHHGDQLPRHIGLYQGLFYRKLADFPDQVERYLSIFGHNNVHVILYDDFKTDPHSVYCQLCDFIGIDSEVLPTFNTVNANKVARFRWARALLWSPPPGLRKLGYHMLPNSRVRSYLRKGLRRITTVNQPRKPLDPLLRKQLQQQFTPSIKRLSKVLERDLSFWMLE